MSASKNGTPRRSTNPARSPMFSALSDGRYSESTYSTVGKLSTAVATSHSSTPSASRATAARSPDAAVSPARAMGGERSGGVVRRGRDED